MPFDTPGAKGARRTTGSVSVLLGATVLVLFGVGCVRERVLGRPVSAALPETPTKTLVPIAAKARAEPELDLEEATISDLQTALESGKTTTRGLVQAYLRRIEAVDRRGPALRSVIEVNPEALALADALDAERRAKGPRGPLHGIPILIKDNIDTGDRMLTTAGSLALASKPAPKDAFIVARLRQAGALILGKTNLSEWANFRSTHSTSGWSARGGLTRNPYVLDRSACGSSSGTGVAIAASLAAVGIGTETDGSIVCPSGVNALVGIKPTLGLVSRSGIVPIAHSQDTAGPMARTVRDAAIVLAAIAGADPSDPITDGRRAEADYTKFLDPGGLKGARIGIARAKVSGYSPAADRVLETAVAALKHAGAEIVDPADIPGLGTYDEAELEVLLYEFKADLNRYLETRGPDVAVRSLKDLIAFNERHADRELAFFGQELLLKADEKGPLTDKAYLAAKAKSQGAAKDGLDRTFTKHKLDAIVALTGSPSWSLDLVNGDHFLGASSTPAAVSGYPAISVPAGFAGELPVGLSFIGQAFSEGKLLRLAYAFEQATNARRPPRFTETLDVVRVKRGEQQAPSPTR